MHSGFLPVWHYERVIVLNFEAGEVRSIEDWSQRVAEFRAKKTGTPVAASGGAAGGDSDPGSDDDNAFERFMSSLKVRFGLEEG